MGEKNSLIGVQREYGKYQNTINWCLSKGWKKGDEEKKPTLRIVDTEYHQLVSLPSPIDVCTM